jgi:hypothetical protein
VAKEFETTLWVEIAEFRGHNLRRDPENDGRVDHFAVSHEFCNGPVCTICDMSWCEHCTSIDRIRPCPGPD